MDALLPNVTWWTIAWFMLLGGLVGCAIGAVIGTSLERRAWNDERHLATRHWAHAADEFVIVACGPFLETDRGEWATAWRRYCVAHGIDQKLPPQSERH